MYRRQTLSTSKLFSVLGENYRWKKKGSFEVLKIDVTILNRTAIADLTEKITLLQEFEKGFCQAGIWANFLRADKRAN